MMKINNIITQYLARFLAWFYDFLFETEETPVRPAVNPGKPLIEVPVDVKSDLLDLQNEYRAIQQSNTYLIYQRKSQFLKKCGDFALKINQLYLKKTNFSQEARDFFWQSLKDVKHYEKVIDGYNEQFVQGRILEYDWLFKKSPYPLDLNQRRAVTTDDKHNLVIAGAGSGKTETLITRIAYLTLRKPDTVLPERILALAFQNKAAQEMRDRLKERFGVEVKIKTFHSLGLEILQKGLENPPQLMFSGDNFDFQYRQYISKIFNELKETPDFRKDILRYIIYFGENYLIREEKDFSKKAEFFRYINNLSYTALNGVKVKSKAECAILNFLLTHTINGKQIRVQYESPATWIQYLNSQGKEKNPRPDFFLPDFDIYIEHWAIDRKGAVPSWFSGTDASKKYVDAMNAKRAHFSSQTRFSLLETYHWEFVEPEFLEKFQLRLMIELKKKIPSEEFVIEELYPDAIIEKVWKENKESIDDLSKNCAQFIQIAKTYHLSPADIRTRLVNEKWTGRQRAFATVAAGLYHRYEADLRMKNCIDFADMINRTIEELHSQTDLYRNVFDHILIDEYQDISTQRSNLIKELMQKNEGCKLFCVGDDWQSIMGFTGSNLDFFVNFGNYFDHPARTDLTVNYRSCKSIVDLGAAIIKQNGDAQIKKVALAKDPKQRQITVYSSKFTPRQWKQYHEQMLNHCVDRIEQYLENGYRPEEILIPCRMTIFRALGRVKKTKPLEKATFVQGGE
jgi:DNA helicase-4